MLVRVLGHALRENKKVFIAITDICGIGLYRAKVVCEALNIDMHKKAKELTETEIHSINKYIGDNFMIGDDLKKYIIDIKKSLINSGSFRGKRLKNGLPARGQKTGSNGKTARKIKHI